MHFSSTRLSRPHHSQRCEYTYPVLVDNLDNSGDLALRFTIRDEDDAADLDVALERHTLSTHGD